MAYPELANSTSKRDEILDLAERIVIEKGVSATTIDELIFEVGISKSGFFYHFQDKNQLVEAILERNLISEEQWFNGLFQRADKVSNDPLGRLLNFLDLFAEEMEDLPGIHPGCLTTACCYQERLLNDAVQERAKDILLLWRKILLKRLETIAATHPPKIDIDLEALADMLSALIDGAIIFSRVFFHGS
jgi:AcrR family transcriptional regulator